MNLYADDIVLYLTDATLGALRNLSAVESYSSSSFRWRSRPKIFLHTGREEAFWVKHLWDTTENAFPLTFRGSTVVMTVTSMKGFGLLAVSSMRDCHWRGNPTNFCSCSSKSVWTRCSKLDGAEIWIRDFFFLANMVATAASQHQICSEEEEKAAMWLANKYKRKTLVHQHNRTAVHTFYCIKSHMLAHFNPRTNRLDGGIYLSLTFS